MKDSITISPCSNSPSIHDVERIGYGNVAIYKTSTKPMDNDVYFLVDSREPDSSLSIDAVADVERLIRLVGHVGAQVRTTVITHSHGDHIQAPSELLQAFPTRHITSSLDAADILKPVDQRLDGDEAITFGQSITLPISILCGYTEGGLYFDLSAKATGMFSDDTPPYHLFVGDSTFLDGVGRTCPFEDFSQFVDDVESRALHVYPVNSAIHPGHGKGITVGVESPEVES